MKFDFESASDAEMTKHFGDPKFGLDGRWSDQTLRLMNWKGVEKLDLLPLWALTPQLWKCPGCGRAKEEIAFESKGVLWAKLFAHHDHAGDFAENWQNRHNHGGWEVEGWSLERFCVGYVAPFLRRFDDVVVCHKCNDVDAEVKAAVADVDEYFSFNVEEIARVVKCDPKEGHKVDLDLARSVYEELKPMHLHRMSVGERLIDMAKKRRPWADKPPIRGTEFNESRVMEAAESHLLSLLSDGQSGMPLYEFFWRSVKYDGFGINGPRKLRLTGKVPSPEDCARFKVKDISRQAAWDTVGDDWKCAGCGRSKCETLRWSKSKTWTAGLFCDHDSQRGSPERLYRCHDCNIVPTRFRDWLKITSTPDPWENMALESRAATNELLHTVIAVRDHEMHEIDFKKILELMRAAAHGHIEPDSLFVQGQLYWRPPANSHPDLFD